MVNLIYQHCCDIKAQGYENVAHKINSLDPLRYASCSLNE